ncbi:zinc finger protein ush [Lucilia sericata]|uniref:zinc finger protein ush n=1 Tax=Lucilia sericata TaxID=13632 RepID=UPI0018A86985|nr:zinc finger protein ush [Lucilia sericata]
MFGDCSDSTEDMTVDSRDSKDFNPNNTTSIMDDHTDEDRRTPQNNHYSQQQTKETDIEMTESQNPEQIEMEHNEEDADSQPPQQKRPKMEVELEYRRVTTPVQSPVNRNTENSNDSEKCDDFQNQIDESNSKDRRSSSPLLKAITPAISPSPIEVSNENICSPTSGSMPKLRLNALLASDPALMPDAKDLKVVHEESQTQQRIARLEQHLQQQLQTEETESNENDHITPTATTALVETAIKPLTTPVEAPQRMKVFMCLPCGIGFSSPSTLEAHQAYYCSHRHKESEDDSSLSAAIAEKSSASPTQANNPTANISLAPTEPAAKVPKTGKQYACTQCSYSADKKVSLNRHMRMHQTSPAPSSNASNNGSAIMEDNSSQQVDRYCSDCDIRFNNVKTYRAHKQHYCSSRRTEGQLTPKLEVSTTTSTPKAPAAVVSGAISPQTRTKTPTPAMVAAAAAAAAAALQQPPATPFLALPTNPILIIPYALIRSASLIAGPLSSPSPSVVNPDTTCFTLDNGNLKPLATALNINALSAASTAANSIAAAVATGQQINVVDSTRQSNATETLLTEKNIKRNVEESTENPTHKRKGEGFRESAPLDLSLRRSPIAALLQRQRFNSATTFLENEQQRLDMETLLEAGKENLALDETGSITPEQIVCAPSLPNSPSMSPSPRRRAISPRSSGAGSTSSMSPPATIPPNALSAATNPTNILDNLQLRSMLPAELLNPLLAKQNMELALKLSAAAAAAVSSSSGGVNTAGSTPSDLAAAVAAATGRGSLLGLPVLPPAPAASVQVPTASANQPQIYVKQGVSKCKECNIVFCKYENYLAHKQHYCSARNQEPSEGEAKVSPTPPMAAGASPAETTPVAYQQLICAACGIKYTSLDNLRAHQNYYCPKGGGVAAAAAAAVASNSSDTSHVVMKKEKCSKCKTLHETSLPCPPPPALQQPTPTQTLATATTQQQQQQHTASTTSTGSSSNQNLYKCPLCDAVSLTASESRKHMETHGTVKAFRCTICRYKGNTLRGMRTHIRMHFDKKTSDINEEHYMACILEDENIEIPSAASLNQEHLVQQLAAAQQQQQQQKQLVAAAAVVAAGLQQQHQHQQQQQQQSQQQQQVFNCDICNYSSTYKGNVLRHMKLVHPHVIPNSPSISPEVGDLETTETASLSSSHNGDNNMNNFTIKSEPLDHHTASNTSPAAVLLNPHDNNNSPIPTNIIHNNPNELMHHIKSEPMEISIEPSALHIPQPPPTLRSPAIGPPPLLNATPEENINQKYCQTCDISFNYMKTYLAHKQFYCKNKLRRPDTNDSPSPNAGNIIANVPSPNTLMMQKNKENLQEAAI